MEIALAAPPPVRESCRPAITVGSAGQRKRDIGRPGSRREGHRSVPRGGSINVRCRRAPTTGDLDHIERVPAWTSQAPVCRPAFEARRALLDWKCEAWGGTSWHGRPDRKSNVVGMRAGECVSREPRQCMRVARRHFHAGRPNRLYGSCDAHGCKFVSDSDDGWRHRGAGRDSDETAPTLS